MKQFAGFLVLRFNTPRTPHSYYRQMRLVHEHCMADPATITESDYRDYILHVKTVKRWKPKTIRQAAAGAILFFMEMLGLGDWKVFSQSRAKDEKTLPAVLTRSEVIRLLKSIRLRRYRIPLKLIYCCGLRVSECLSLTIHDIDAKGGKLWLRNAKGNKDRMVPISKTMIEDLRRFLPGHLREHRHAMNKAQRRAVWAITHCRTAEMGGHLHACASCKKREFHFHSCNHRSCPQCGKNATAQWVERELGKRVGAPYFMVTFTLPEELRPLFFSPQAKEVYQLFFAAASSSLTDTLANPRWLGAATGGFTMVLHTWNQRLHFHPHIHSPGSTPPSGKRTGEWISNPSAAARTSSNIWVAMSAAPPSATHGFYP